VNASDARELERRRGDLENALKTVGRILADADTLVELRRGRDQITGILAMYDCAPAKVQS